MLHRSRRSSTQWPSGYCHDTVIVKSQVININFSPSFGNHVYKHQVGIRHCFLILSSDEWKDKDIIKIIQNEILSIPPIPDSIRSTKVTLRIPDVYLSFILQRKSCVEKDAKVQQNSSQEIVINNETLCASVCVLVKTQVVVSLTFVLICAVYS